MRLLIVIPYVPNLIRVRPYQIIRALRAGHHEITLATLWSTDDERKDLAALESLGITIIAEELTRLRSLWNTVRTVPTQRPLQANYCWHPRLAERLALLVAETTFDAIHVEHLRGARYGLHLQKAVSVLSARNGGPQIPVIWDSVDCISHLFEQAASQSRSLQGRLMTRLDLRRTQLFEGFLVNQFGQVVTTSLADAQALSLLAEADAQRDSNHGSNAVRDGKIHALPNGVDLDYFQPMADVLDADSMGVVKSDADKPDTDEPEADKPTIVFSGKMSYHANVTAALYLVEEIMPIVWVSHPDVQVQIVGKDPGTTVRGLVEKGRKPGSNDSRVLVTGTVPDLRPYLSAATVAVAPVPYGAGIQNKVLEAMACGAPVVASAQAASGVVAEAGQDLLVANSAESFGQAILTLLADNQQRLALAKAGRRYVESHHSWNRVAERLTDIYCMSSEL